MIKILQVTRSMDYDGIANFVMNYYRHMDRTQFDFHFITCSRTPERFDDEIRNLCGTIHRLPSRNRKPLEYMRQLHHLIRQEKFDIVHIHQNSASMAMDAWVARVCGVPVTIGHSHSTSCNTLWQHYLFRPFVNSLVTHRLACSEEAGKWVFGRRAQVRIIRNAIDAPKFCYNERKRTEMREELGLKDKFVAGFVGGFETPKNLFRCIDIFETVLRKHAESVLLLVGDGKQKKDLQQYVSEKGLTSKVIFAGRRKDVENFFQAMDVFLLPSLYEGLGIVSIEAQAADLPCVVSTNVPTPNINGKCRYVSLDCTDAEWAEAVLAAQSGARTDQSIKIAESGYDIEREAGVLSDFYRSCTCHLDRR